MVKFKVSTSIVMAATIGYSLIQSPTGLAQPTPKLPPVAGQQGVPQSPFWNSQNMPPQQALPQQYPRQAPVHQPGNSFNFQPRRFVPPPAYQGQGPSMPPPQARGYPPHPPQQYMPPPQYRGGPGWGNRGNNFGPFGGFPFNNSFTNFGNGGTMPFSRNGGPFNWFSNGPKEGMAEMWEEMLHAPSDMGDMPGGWSFPDIGVPNPVDVGDQFGEASEELAKEMPEFAKELPDMFNFRPY